MNQHSIRIAIFALIALLSGCGSTRSISNPARGYGAGNSTYNGELSDFDVVGVSGVDGASADVSLRPGMRVLVLQSGAIFPDQGLLSALAAHFQVGSASGIPTHVLGEQGMRGAAARGGFDAVVAYWGILETTERANAGAAASWVPIAGMFVPDTNQLMRIRLRIVVLDVHSGRWRTILPEPIDDDRASSMLSREKSDRDQVELLMRAALPAAIEQLLKSN
jgi:hypothetical protein